ncbi:MAG: hypothetical protein LUQ11_07720, partial [Methylococcaceae bacterium]|nr:hypothetical protein [Methylococcaceae bacterium]
HLPFSQGNGWTSTSLLTTMPVAPGNAAAYSGLHSTSARCQASIHSSKTAYCLFVTIACTMPSLTKL